MKIQKIASSTVIITTDDCKILCDPWIENGEYFGSWSIVEKINKEKFYKEMNKCEFIYLSHIHPDHFSKKTLNNISKEKKVIIHSYASPFLKKNLEILGFKNVIEINHNEKQNLKGKTSIVIYAADDCDPNVCRKFAGCNYSGSEIGKKSHQIDTCAIITDKSDTCLNLNDCEFNMMESTIKKINQDFTKINILLVNYNSAHSYPQNIKNFSENDKLKISHDLKKLTLQKSVSFIQKFQPDYFIPFAGEYTISGKLYNLNKYKGTNSQKECYEYFISSEFKDNLIMLNYGEEFDSKNPVSNFKIKNDQEYIDYENSFLKNIKYEYENDPKPTEETIEQLAIKAFERLQYKIKNLNLNFDHSLFIKYFNKYIFLNLKTQKISLVSSINDSIENYTILELDEKLLIRLLKGPKYAHWNNADIGSHIFFTRSNAHDYNYKIWNSIAYFHA